MAVQKRIQKDEEGKWEKAANSQSTGSQINCLDKSKQNCLARERTDPSPIMLSLNLNWQFLGLPEKMAVFCR